MRFSPARRALAMMTRRTRGWGLRRPKPRRAPNVLESLEGRSLMASTASYFRPVAIEAEPGSWSATPFEQRMTDRLAQRPDPSLTPGPDSPSSSSRSTDHLSPSSIRSAKPLRTPRPGAPRRLTGIVYNRIGGHSAVMDLKIPAGDPPTEGWPVILAFPGGGWQSGDRVGIARSLDPLVKQGYIVAGVDYFYGEAFNPYNRAWPAAFIDARAAVRWVREHAGMLGADPERIIAYGESAGGHIAAMLGVYPDGPIAAEGLPVQALRRDPAPISARVQAFVSLYGPLNIGELYRTSPAPRPNFLALIGGKPFQFPERYVAASPTSHVTPDDSPGLLIHGVRDPGVYFTQSLKISKLLDQQNVFNRVVLVRPAGHGFRIRGKNFDFTPQLTSFLDEVQRRQRGEAPDASVPQWISLP